MSERLKILIATANLGKLEEIRRQLAVLPVDVLGLEDVEYEGKKLRDIDCDEPFDTTEENAIRKARFYGEKANLLTFAEDTAFFVKSLEGKPGVHAKRYFQESGLKTEQEWNEEIIRRMEGISEEERDCYFETSGVLYDPDNSEQINLFKGKAEGKVTDTVFEGARQGVGYDAIFFHEPSGKTFAEMTTEEKAEVSHRGNVIRQFQEYVREMLALVEARREINSGKRI